MSTWDPPIPGGFKLYDRVLFQGVAPGALLRRRFEGLVIAVVAEFEGGAWRHAVHVYEPGYGQRIPFKPAALVRANHEQPTNRGD